MNILRLFSKAEYTVGYRICEKDILDDSDTPFIVIPRNKKEWYADPFPFCYNDEFYIFMEVMQKDKGYAGIGYSKLVDGKLTAPKIVIDTGSHYSFPFIFQKDGEIYILPESGTEKKLKLFKATDFPEKWEEYYALPTENGLYDSVPFELNGKRYLFTSEHTKDMYGSRLFLMELEKDSLKPEILIKKIVSTDYRNSRQAGKMIEKDGKLIRVAQDCSNNEYGRAIEFLEVDDMEDYSEHLIRHIEPTEIKTQTKLFGIMGTHTYNRIGNFDVIDFKVLRFYPKVVFIKIGIVLNMIKDKIK